MINKLKEILKIRKREPFAILIAFSVIAFWRGIWGLMDIYILPSSPVLSYAISVMLGLGILLYTHYASKELL